ncbi:hypothetical protein B0H13DRAFT_2356466 [Mycena leptocephala]|nr:hypothetical protein B0H13DRAFT_2356466 [Mycena leptocephala]
MPSGARVLASEISAHETDRTWAWESKAAWGPSSYADNLITNLIIQSVETASFSTFNSIMDFITFTVLQNTNFHSSLHCCPDGCIPTRC